MADLSTNYMGLALRNPIIAASSSLTGSLEGVKKCAAAGAGAIVLKSLFEEQIAAEIGALSEYAEYAGHGEASEYLQGYGMELGPRDYLQLVRDAKKAVDVPIIPSLNCFSNERWSDYAHQLESAGADAIELNIGVLPNQEKQTGAAVEELHLRIFHEVKSRVKIPVAVKLGPYFSSFANLAQKLSADRIKGPDFTVGWCGPGEIKKEVIWQGADALVLFNRFYQLDIDIDKMKLVPGNPHSTPAEIHTALRWMLLLSGKVDCDLAATTGIHDGRGAIKQILAGATVVQVCSTLYKNGFGQIGKMLEEIGAWMDAHKFATLGAFRGRLSQAHSDKPESYERLQYIKVFVGID
ncbi:diguanylate cyclase [Desulfuromonas versatilis]|uniref:Diguanylate cyclase n=1 Tax=Desulfuromonas versatilis TaxID=2802975 RepID=A0ABM8HWA7_9BACT|nr:dihydroorotate dehydrogenase-like protein [Desulfuromonas versatilis]BCR05038.1 diguanylate cyclase [Desulfuromonas versatilis]